MICNANPSSEFPRQKTIADGALPKALTTGLAVRLSCLGFAVWDLRQREPKTNTQLK